MGGFAALSAFFRRPQLFAGVGAQMPALFTMDYTNPSEVEAFVKRTGTPKEAIEFLLSLLKPEFVDLADYKGCDPIALAKRIPSRILAGKTLCFDVGSADSFGCFEGADALHEILQDQNVPHEYEKAAGGLHDVNFLLSRVSSLLANVLK